MAKKETTKTDPAGNEAESTPRKTEFIKLLKTPGADDKVAPQMKGVIDALVAMGAKKKEVSYDDLCGGDAPVLMEHIETKQPAPRIYGFYRSKLIAGGFISSERRAA